MFQEPRLPGDRKLADTTMSMYHLMSGRFRLSIDEGHGKSNRYEMYSFNSCCIGSERHLNLHGRMKKLISHAFSTRTLLEPKRVIQASIDALIDKIGPECSAPKKLNVREWYQVIAFDVLGDMASEESFHCVNNGK